jgi:hypothetical protein
MDRKKKKTGDYLGERSFKQVMAITKEKGLLLQYHEGKVKGKETGALYA